MLTSLISKTCSPSVAQEKETTIGRFCQKRSTPILKLFTVILCKPKDYKRLQHLYLRSVWSQIKNEGFLKVVRSHLLIFISKHLETAKIRAEQDDGKSSEVASHLF